MTCIIGLVDGNGDIYMGADSAGVSGFDIRERKDSKIFIKGNMIFGFTSSFRMGQIIQYKLNIPEQSQKLSDYEYMCTAFIDAVIRSLKECGYATINNNEVSGGIFLVGYKGNLYKVESDFQVGQLQQQFDSCGCGEYYALGALYILMGLQPDSPKDNINTALTVASTYSSGVSMPFNIICLSATKHIE
jgi:ATP-dependent protease HslVU (ClpYQ) peptidase subunit